MQVNHLHCLVNSTWTCYTSHLLQEVNWDQIHRSFCSPNTQVGHGHKQEPGIPVPCVPWKSQFNGLGEQGEGLQTWTERNAARCLEKGYAGTLLARLSGFGHPSALKGPGSMTANNNSPQGEKFGSMHCSSGLPLLEAKLALDTNPLNNFQLLSKSTGLVNHESLSWCTTPLRFQSSDLFVQKLFICPTNRNNVKLTNKKKNSHTPCLISKGI